MKTLLFIKLGRACTRLDKNHQHALNTFNDLAFDIAEAEFKRGYAKGYHAARGDSKYDPREAYTEEDSER